MSDDSNHSDHKEETTNGESQANELVAKTQESSTPDSNKPDDTSATNSPKLKQKRPRKTGSKKHFPWVAATILLVIVALGAGNYWQFQQGLILKQSQQQFGQQLSDTAAQIANLNSQLSDTGNYQKTLALKTQENEDAQQDILVTLDQMSQQMKALATSKGKEPLFWRVSEVEYLLSVANHRLILEKDLSTAQTALQDADNRLRTIGDPGLIPVRKKVAEEINLLKQIKLPDIPGMATQLNAMANNIEMIPFVKDARTLDSIQKSDDKEETGASGFASKVMADITKGLFTIQRSDEPIEPLLPPEEKHYLKHNLNLKLEQARVALLNQETGLFQQNLEAIEQWTNKYFDGQDQSVTNLLQAVEKMKQVELQPVGRTYRSLR